MTPKQSSTETAEIIRLARKRFALAAEAETENRKDAVDDIKFRAGQQWPEDIRNARYIDKRPCLTINRIPQFLHQVTNEQRQNRPSIKVNPVDDKGDVETAEVLQGMVRHIEYASNAEVAYDTAADGQCTHGFGYFRVNTQYCDPMSFDQDLVIKRIKDPFSVYLDPSYSEPDGSDMNWAFIVQDMTSDEYKAEYGGSALAKMDNWDSLGGFEPGWMKKDGCRVAEYYTKEMKSETICMLSSGETVKKSEIPAALYESMRGPEAPEGKRIVSERTTEIPTVKWRKINGMEVLEETEWLGKWIPIIPVLGVEILLEGKRILEGVIRNAKDPQRMYNYWATAETEMIALAPKAPFIGVEGQFEDHETEWMQANTRNLPYLEYKPTSVDGKLAPAPQRNMVEPPVQAITSARQLSAEDLKATTGIYDASLGNRSNEQSGVAIQRRNNQSEVSNFHYADNFTRSLRHCGRILVDLIPKIYDTERAVRILGDDGTQEIVTINAIFQKQGKDVIYDLDKGTYDVTVSTGPSYQTKRQEAVASMLELVRSIPESMQYALDLLVRKMDWPGAEEIAERLKKGLPPQFQEPEDGEQQPVPPQAQAAIAQLRQMVQQLTQQLQQSNDIIHNKKFELASKERIETLKMQNDLVLEQMKHDAKHAQVGFQAEVATLHKRLDLLPSPSDLNTGSGPTAANPNQPTGGQSPGNNVGV